MTRREAIIFYFDDWSSGDKWIENDCSCRLSWGVHWKSQLFIYMYDGSGTQNQYAVRSRGAAIQSCLSNRQTYIRTPHINQAYKAWLML